MKTATISVVKAKFSEYLDAVSRGEDVVVTKRGRPVAHIVPISREVAEDERLSRLVARGLVRPPKKRGSLREVVSQWKPDGPDVPLEVILRAIREERDET